MDAIPWWGWIAIVLGALFTLPYWLGPFLIHGSQKMPAHPEFDSLPIEGDVPAEAEEYFSTCGKSFEELGFRKLARLRQDKFLPDVKTFVDLWHDANSGIAVVAVAAFGRVRTPDGVREGLKATYVQFASSFTDDTAVLTSNTRVIEVFARVPEKVHYKFRTNDIASLCGAHKKLEAPFARGKTRKSAPADPASHLGESMNRELSAQIRTGYLYEEDGFFRPTWKGAICMVYKSLPPLKGWLQQRELRESEKALERVG